MKIISSGFVTGTGAGRGLEVADLGEISLWLLSRRSVHLLEEYPPIRFKILQGLGYIFYRCGLNQGAKAFV